jgi:DNA-directed RNA polymerase subunit RPC12/RpoP
MRYFQKCPYCKGKAFEYNREPQNGEIVDMLLVDNVTDGEIMKCSICWKQIPDYPYLSKKYLIIE